MITWSCGKCFSVFWYCCVFLCCSVLRALLIQKQIHNIGIFSGTIQGKQCPWRPLKLFQILSSVDISVSSYTPVLLVEEGLSLHSIRKTFPCVHDNWVRKHGSCSKLHFLSLKCCEWKALRDCSAVLDNWVCCTYTSAHVHEMLAVHLFSSSFAMPRPREREVWYIGQPGCL